MQHQSMLKNTPVNLLLENLPHKVRNRIFQQSDIVELAFGDVLCRQDQPYEHIYFPLSGSLSLIINIGKHPPLEMGMIGNEGMLGVKLVLGFNIAQLKGEVLGPGTALRMTAPLFRRELRENITLRRSLNRYLHVLIAQLSRIAACTHFHEVEARLARWLLMAHDRAHTDHIYFTHQTLANMLGVQRSAITIAAGALQRQGLIRYIRGDIRILDRAGLEVASCDCYTALIGNYSQLFI